MDLCLFCDAELKPGSEEHVFLSALGAHLVTRKVTCQICNNAFASNQTGKVDDALAEAFVEIRNGLKIWSGRDDPPPTLLRAGTLDNGTEFDLAPGFTPVVRPGRLPRDLATRPEQELVARDQDDAKRMLAIVGKRGFSTKIQQASRVQQRSPAVKLSFKFDGPKVWRSVAKTAVAGFVVMYGNGLARRHIDGDLRSSIRHDQPDIAGFAGWDFMNQWPVIISSSPHPKSPSAQPSGFEHSIIVADVNRWCVAYVEFFRDWRFSVRLGPATGLPIRGLAVNPRATKPARFVVDAIAPAAYQHRYVGCFQSEHAQILQAAGAATNRAMSSWNAEARVDYAQQLSGELDAAIEAAGENEGSRATAIKRFATRLAVLEHGAAWVDELDKTFGEDTAAELPEPPDKT
ncbi:hypothetical protein [Roseomonas gilardii]|uniref:hypothetical protein n=1 Tax=Roseomonas gilardii TaxID=257708 RepID=UPI0011A5AF1D|nr:hypothetical protein [Roseomonas gilardii]